MKEVNDIMDRCQEEGITLSLTADRKQIRASKKLPEDLKADITKHKAGVMLFLAAELGFNALWALEREGKMDTPDYANKFMRWDSILMAFETWTPAE